MDQDTMDQDRMDKHRMDQHRIGPTDETRSRRRAMVGVLAPLALVLASLGVGVEAATAPAVEAQGCAPRISVSRTSGLAPGGETVSVSGSCFDVNKGIYIAFCVVPPPGAVPSPCGGGVDQSGASGLSHWISSNPPPYGEGVATPYGPGGSFAVSMTPSATLSPTVDCRRVRCAIVTRNDHTRTGDRGQDVIVPVSFASDPAPVTTPTASVVIAPPSTEAPTTVAPETTTTAAPETTSTTASADESSTDDGSQEDEVTELAVDTASADGGSSSGGGAVVVVVAVLVAVLVVVALVGGAVWLAVHRRRSVPGAP
jgi:hypothetical protein